MHVAGDFVLPGWVGYDLLVLEHELVPLEELIVSRGTAQPALFRTICAVGVFAIFEVEADLVEAFFANELFAVPGRQVSSVYDGIDESIGVAPQVAAFLYATDTLEAQGVPDAA